METCPHGSRILCAVGEPVVFVDGCGDCENLLRDLGFGSPGRVVLRETVIAQPRSEAVPA